MDIQYCIKYAALAVALLGSYAGVDYMIMRATGRIDMPIPDRYLPGLIAVCIAWAVYFAL